MKEKQQFKEEIIEETLEDGEKDNSKFEFDKFINQNLDELDNDKLLETAKMYQAFVQINLSQMNAMQSELEKKKELESKIDGYISAARRIQKDFDNFKRNNAESVKNAEIKGIVKTVEGLLETVDNFERAFAAVNSGDLKGFEMIYKQLMSFLSALGISEIEAENIQFNPEFHNAIAQSDSDKQSGTIIEVIKKGYKLGDTIIRYSQVVVAK